MKIDERLAQAEDALQRGDWQTALARFEATVEAAESPRALEGLGTVLWWLDEQNRVLETRERAFRLYRNEGDHRSAARLATAIAIDYADYRGDIAVANGWLQRAESLLRELDPVVEHGWLTLFQGYFELMFHNDIAAARDRLEDAAVLAPGLGSIDLEMMIVALRGLILIREGRVTEGMRHLDEAMTAAVDGEMSDLAAIGNTCCSLIYACEAVADYDRAYQWCERTRALCRRLGFDTFFAICRNYYATVLIWKGDWEEAAAELSAAMQELETNRPNYAQESFAKLGELRRRQGRLEEAETYFTRAEPHRLALLGRARLAVDRGDLDGAIDLAERCLRRTNEEDQADRVFALELLVRCYLLKGHRDKAAEYVASLDASARFVGTRALLATSSTAAGLLAMADGDCERARHLLEDAVDALEATDADFEAARIRLDLVEALAGLDRRAAALEQAMLAQTSFKRLGAALYADRATTLAGRLSSHLGAPPAGSSLPHGLTPREAEVLWLIAAGKTNLEIADDLVLSVRTVERHISTIYEKLQLHGRAARASAAAIAAGLRDNT